MISDSPYTIKIITVDETEDMIADFVNLHTSDYTSIKDEKTNLVIVEIKGFIEFDFIKGTKTLTVRAKDM